MEQESVAPRWLDYVVLAARVLLAIVFLTYGLAKLRDGQFGISAAELAQPVGKLSLFRLFWYLADHQPFKAFVGVAQVVAALLLLWNRTAVLGALLLLPIASNILIIDITFLQMPALNWRVGYYLGLLGLVLWYYRARLRAAFRLITRGLGRRYRYPWWAWGLLPVAALALELAGALPQLAVGLLTRPAQTLHSLATLAQQLPALLRQLLGS